VNNQKKLQISSVITSHQKTPIPFLANKLEQK